MVGGRSRSAVSGSFVGAQKFWPAGAGRFPRLSATGGGVSTPKSRARRHHETHSHQRRSRQNWERAAEWLCGINSLGLWFASGTCASRGSSRNPPRNALLLWPARHPSSSFFNFLTLPPPITTSRLGRLSATDFRPSIVVMFFAPALTSLNTISVAVFADRAPFVRTVR